MVFVKVRETYDLHTVRNKMTVIAIHTPKTDIIKRNYPGLLMQCKAYRPVSADVRIACASVMPLDVKSVGTTEGDVAPEDVFNPILYKAMSNKGMSQLEARINALQITGTGIDVDGISASIDADTVVPGADDFNVYYGLLSDTHGWKHAMPQAGLSMKFLKPLVWEMVYNVGDMDDSVFDGSQNPKFAYPGSDDKVLNGGIKAILGNSKSMPFLPCTSYSFDGTGVGEAAAGFPNFDWNAEIDVPYLNVVVGAIIVPPSRLHELFYRMVVEWTIEFTAIRPFSDIVRMTGLASFGNAQHWKNYDYSQTKKAVTESEETILDSDSCMVSANVEVDKVM